MKFIDIIKEDGELIVHDWKVVKMGMEQNGIFSILTYSSGYNPLAMFPVTIKVIYLDDYTDPDVEILSGEKEYYENWYELIMDGMQVSHEFFGYSANGITRNGIEGVYFNVNNGVVDYENPMIKR